jgi:uncharacterized protein YdeI (YjbR/CyaY-like superfamily)
MESFLFLLLIKFYKMSASVQIDHYILKAQPFAQPILNHLRALIHHACPDVEEKIKWSMPHFNYKGGPLVHMAAFKQHCAFGFWKAALMNDATLLENAKEEKAMGHMGKITSMADLPSDKKIINWIKAAMKLNDAGIKAAKVSAPKTALPTPDYLKAALKKRPEAEAVFNAFSPACKREYVEWITTAKTEATRNKRMEQAVAWMAEGKKRNWKYEK